LYPISLKLLINIIKKYLMKKKKENYLYLIFNVCNDYGSVEKCSSITLKVGHLTFVKLFINFSCENFKIY